MILLGCVVSVILLGRVAPYIWNVSSTVWRHLYSIEKEMRTWETCLCYDSLWEPKQTWMGASLRVSALGLSPPHPLATEISVFF